MRLVDTKNLKQYILANFSQEQLVAKLLDVSEDDVLHCLEHRSNKIKNPLRDDNHASLGMMWATDGRTRFSKIKLRDFSDSYYRGDCFDFAGMIFRLNPNIPEDFISICNVLISIATSSFVNVRRNMKEVPSRKELHTIACIGRDYEKLDYNYWMSQGVLPNELIPNKIYAIFEATYDGRLLYKYNKKDPCYCYMFGRAPSTKTDIVQLYFPFREKPRFRTNNIYSLNDMWVYPEGDILILTKSYKDEVAIKSLIARSQSLKDLKIVIKSVSSENANLTHREANQLRTLYTHIFTNFDFDRAGIRYAYHLKREFGFEPLFLTNGMYGTYDYKAKDYSEYYNLFGEQASIKLLHATYEHIINLILAAA